MIKLIESVVFVKDDELEGFVSVDLPEVDVSHVPGEYSQHQNYQLASYECSGAVYIVCCF